MFWWPEEFHRRDWARRAQRLREGFHRPFDSGGYWIENQPRPIAWRRANGGLVTLLETFGVFEALRAGLITPADGPQYQSLLTALHDKLPQLIDGPMPMRLALGGYDRDMRRDVGPRASYGNSTLARLGSSVSRPRPTQPRVTPTMLGRSWKPI